MPKEPWFSIGVFIIILAFQKLVRHTIKYKLIIWGRDGIKISFMGNESGILLTSGEYKDTFTLKVLFHVFGLPELWQGPWVSMPFPLNKWGTWGGQILYRLKIKDHFPKQFCSFHLRKAWRRPSVWWFRMFCWRCGEKDKKGSYSALWNAYRGMMNIPQR